MRLKLMLVGVLMICGCSPVATPSNSSVKTGRSNEDSVASGCDDLLQLEELQPFYRLAQKSAVERGDVVSVGTRKSLLLARRWAAVTRAGRSVRLEALRFTGYLEGMCEIATPTWWQERFGDCVLAEHDDVRFAVSTDSSWSESLSEKLRIVGHVGSLFENGDVKWTDIDGHVWRIPADSRIAGYRGKELVVVASDDSNVYVCWFGSIAFTYDLLALDKSDGSVRWRAKVWATGRYGWSGPIPEFDHRVELMVTDGNVFVFGASVVGAYCEAFRCIDGRGQLRFTTVGARVAGSTE